MSYRKAYLFLPFTCMINRVKMFQLNDTRSCDKLATRVSNRTISKWNQIHSHTHIQMNVAGEGYSVIGGCTSGRWTIQCSVKL